MLRSLHIWLHNQHVATIAEPRTNKFTIAYERNVGIGASLSLGLPVRADRYSPSETAPYLGGLIPPAHERSEASHLDFKFLESHGADLPGAAQFLPVGQSPTTPDRMSGRPVTQADHNDELAVVLIDGEWLVPAPTSASSHIARPEDPMLPGSAAAETLTLRLAAAVGQLACEAQLTTMFDVPTLVVGRPDRSVVSGKVQRHHLEDFGQACGANRLRDPEAIYEQNGGPGFANLAAAIAESAASSESADPDNTVEPLAALERLAKLMALNVVTGNTNAHAGSYTLLAARGLLGPVNSMLPAEIYTEIHTADGVVPLNHSMAMTINGHWQSDEVKISDLISEAAAWPVMTVESATGAIQGVLEELPAALAAVATGTPEAPPKLLQMISAKIDQIHSAARR